MERNAMRLEHYKKQNSLLGYFKYQLLKAGRQDIKYFNRAFLNTFMNDYNASKAGGVADYTATAATDFYNKNSGTYCAFLEIWNDYKSGMERLKAAE